MLKLGVAMKRKQKNIYDHARKTIRAYRRNASSFLVLSDEQIAAKFRKNEPDTIPKTWIDVKNSWLYKEKDGYIVAGYQHLKRNRQYFDTSKVKTLGLLISAVLPTEESESYVKVGSNKWVQIDNLLSH
jgi:hypothetical protein